MSQNGVVQGQSSEFDQYAGTYSAMLDESLAVTGETSEFYAEQRIAWLAGHPALRDRKVQRVLDFGCGVGNSVPMLRKHFPDACIYGVDTSAESIAIAQSRWADAQTVFGTPNQFAQQEPVDLVYCNGVLHHIPPADRRGAIASIRGRLTSGGLFVLWENNPWNPGTRYIMARIPFDRDAIPVYPFQARRLLRQGGFHILCTDHCFFFPRILQSLRGLERHLRGLPLGGQYMVLGRA